MQPYVEDLRRTVERATGALLALSDAATARRPAPDKWSPREIIGHLVDSASNNHQRFVRAQFQEDLVFAGYEQDEWVRAQDYQSAPWAPLVRLWRSMNLQLARVMATVPDAARMREHARHNLDRIAWKKVAADRPATLDYFMADYVGHLKHHLRQILGADWPTPQVSERVEEFRRLHASGCFVIPNPWDVGSASLLAGLGFKALATTSSGFAWSLGRADNHVTLDESLGHIRAIAASVPVPVNADFEGGFAADPDGVAANVALAAQTGVAGLSIEDSTGDRERPLVEFTLAVERIRAARRALDASGTGVLLTARSEGFIVGRPDLAETIRRLQAFAEAGADCLYAPGLRSIDDIGAVVSAVSPKPVNILVGGGSTTVAELAAAGVRRISVGGALARAAWAGFLGAAREMAERGTFEALGTAVPFAEINGAFGR
jgi:methylisocitrate lyase